MRISDWSSDVCSSDLQAHVEPGETHGGADAVRQRHQPAQAARVLQRPEIEQDCRGDAEADEVAQGVELGAERRGRLEEARHPRSEEHTSELQSLMRISYAVFCLKKKNLIYLT